VAHTNRIMIPMQWTKRLFSEIRKRRRFIKQIAGTSAAITLGPKLMASPLQMLFIMQRENVFAICRSRSIN